MNREIVCFHNIDEDNGILSNWYMSDFTVDGVKFNCVEQYMMWAKARCFGDEESCKAILDSSSPAEMKAIGRTVKGYIEVVWASVRYDVVYKGVLAKFKDSDYLRGMLLAYPRDCIFAECAVHDRVWGIGLSMTDDNRFDMSKWRGTNYLGEIITRVRDSIVG